MRAISYENENFNISEPFEGLFTQGMVCHETYKDPDKNWVSPEEIVSVNGKKYLKKDKTKKITVGPSESMSKSKKNTIDPEKIITNYGADSARLFILSDSPPEKDVQWSEEGIASSFKFIQKLWNLNLKISQEINKNHKKDTDNEIDKYTNKFLKNIKNNLENFSYNKIIANFHEIYSFLNNQINKNYTKETLIKNYKKILITMIPVIPHFANECLNTIEIEKEIFWPKYDTSLLEEKEIQIVVQINGKKRGILIANKDTNENQLIDIIKNEEKINKHLTNMNIKKTIFIKNKLINLIV